MWLSIDINDQNTEMKFPIPQKAMNSMITWVIISIWRRTLIHEANNISVYIHTESCTTIFRLLRNFNLSYF
jgi:hypothetical protein